VAGNTRTIMRCERCSMLSRRAVYRNVLLGAEEFVDVTPVGVCDDLVVERGCTYGHASCISA